MSIKYDPTEMLRKMAPKTKIKKLLSQTLTLKKAALSFVEKTEVVSKKDVTRVALKTIAGYKKRIKDDPKAKAEILANPAQLIQRVQNEVILQISDEIKSNYAGEFYIWLPSDAEEPDPEHQLNYGKKFQVGSGEMPGERFGCRCGMEILVQDSKLELGE